MCIPALGFRLRRPDDTCSFGTMKLRRDPLARFGASLWIVLVGCVISVGTAVADTARHGATVTALDRYVAQPDSAYAWHKVADWRGEGVTGYAIDMTSQRWLTTAEVDRPEWRHWVLVVKPDNVAHSTALLVISGGSNNPAGEPPRPSRDFIEIAKATRSVLVELRMVPNQPLVFDHDGSPRKEDDLIAYSWAKYLKTGDERWPTRLPMTKAAVRAMDTATAFLASEEGGGCRVDTFVVAGASKRGWTTWTTAIVDRRVVAICPLVIDVLNTEESFRHHYQAYGFYAPAVHDYVTHHVVDWLGTRESKALYAIEDPFSYRDRLTMPKLLINACGDQFFLPDSSQFYFSQLPGTTYLRYVPNADHSLRNTDAARTLLAWHEATVRKLKLPEFTWKKGDGGTLTVTTITKPTQVQLWQATNPKARDFRLETLGPAWTSSPVEGKDGVFTATVSAPAEGWTAYMMELIFDIGAAAPLKLTTNVTVIPDTLPFPPPKSEHPPVTQ
jgi:PhoPQ-activated pathogenicity-related protein